ncbi:hypothetical protein NHX12_029341 [Muraenolepis orangiensis]|uniref:Immediate early response 3-interacting protein 1 n=1 Tax=Muraenolepis orangiensis TaxID=630683 RepID=A0A9Q0IPP4_9TELE|nr:hypothetical protein NHX12_029341 [Muraenolepis orangiensis]
MAFTLYSLIQAAILCVNAVAVLHEERFLSKIGWGVDQSVGGFGDEPGVKVQVMNLIRSVRTVMREVLCLRLLLMVLTSSNFALNPAGLVRVRQTLRTLQPIDELKKGPFTLHARVLEYRTVRGGAEVDVLMSATSRSGHLVWESTLTLLSRERFYKGLRGLTPTGHDQDWPDRRHVKRVAMRVPWSTGLCLAWSFSDYSPVPLLALPARLLLGYRAPCSPSLWMLSVCLAEIEKHRGVDAIRPPVDLTVRFLEPLSVPGQVIITFWETAPEDGGSGLHFQMEQHATNSVIHVEGFICRT